MLPAIIDSTKVLIIIGLATLALGTVQVAAAPGPATMVGTYHCLDHESNATWRFTSTNTVYGSWLVVRAAFPAQNGQPAQTAVTYLGFDPDAKRWNIVSLSSRGSYYTRYSTSADINGSKWLDADPSDGGKAVLRIPSARQYVFDLTTPVKAGKSATSHVVCTQT